MPDSTGPSDPTQLALISLVVRGMVRGAPDQATARLVEQGLAMTKGPITMPTPEGTAAAGELLRLPPGGQEEQELDTLFDGFLPINRRLRDVCSAWQSRLAERHGHRHDISGLVRQRAAECDTLHHRKNVIRGRKDNSACSHSFRRGPQRLPQRRECDVLLP